MVRLERRSSAIDLVYYVDDISRKAAPRFRVSARKVLAPTVDVLGGWLNPLGE